MSKLGASQHSKVYDFGAKVQFGKTSGDYVTHRAGFPEAFFSALQQRGWAGAGQRALDVGTGTGTVARGLAGLGMDVTGIDPSSDMLVAAQQLSEQITFLKCRAEHLPFSDDAFDLVTAGQCWHWFDRAQVASEIKRILRPNGRIVIAHFDWLPLNANLVSATEALILAFNPEWAAAGGTGIYPTWLTDLADAGFKSIETMSFDIDQPYTPEAWRGRIRASAGVAASLPPEDVVRFDTELAKLMERDFPGDVLEVPHRVWLVTAVNS